MGKGNGKIINYGTNNQHSDRQFAPKGNRD